MSQSKLPGAHGEMKFVMKHSFDDMRNLKFGEIISGPIEHHFNIPWNICVGYSCSGYFCFLDCLISTESTDWSMDFAVTQKLFKCDGTQTFPSRNERITSCSKSSLFWPFHIQIQEYIINGKFTVELSVQINKTTGIFGETKVRSFDDEAAKKFSDVALVVGGQKFYVQKAYLATHCSYFEALFFGKFSESQKSEIELKEIDPDDFQKFLDLIYAESSIEAHTVLGILHIAHFSDSKTVIRRCQEFLMEKSNLPLKEKFETAIRYDLKELQTKCISEMKTVDDLRSIVPGNSKDFDHEIWKELLMKSLSMK